MKLTKTSKRKYLSVALAAAFAIALSAGVLAGLGDDNGGAQDININDDRPGGGDCTCPTVYDPVVCKVAGPGGTTIKQVFSNACFAGCAGARECNGLISPL